MFTNETAISQMDELQVRKLINPYYFDVESIIMYLNENNIVTIDVFNDFLTEQGKKIIKLTYLSEFKPVTREVFIKRIPIYFNDVKNNNIEKDGLCDIFYGYATYNKRYNRSLSQEMDDLESFHFESAEGIFKGLDLEPMYQMLEKIYYTYEIPFDRLIGYFIKQCGSFSDFEVFLKWFRYLDLLDEVTETNVFPKNILYSYNVELIKKGKKPIIYMANDFTVLSPKRGGKKMFLRGEFPYDEDGNLALQWIGLWCENVGEIKIKTRNVDSSMPDFIAARFKASLSADISIELKSDSLVLISKETKDEDGTYITWKQRYCGPKLMKFDYSVISKKREKINLSQKEASEMMDINLRTYQRIETGESTPDGLNLIKIMNFYGLDTYEDFVKKITIEDSDYSKFLSGKSPMNFVEEIN